MILVAHTHTVSSGCSDCLYYPTFTCYVNVWSLHPESLPGASLTLTRDEVLELVGL